MRRRIRNPNGSRPRALRCEALEGRHLLTTLVVENHLDGALADLAGDGELSLREAIEIANTGATIDGYTSGDVADTIVFDPAAFTGGAASLIRLTAGELLITESLTIDGSQAEDLVITGDALGNDPLVPGTFLTHIESFGLAATAEYYQDNTRVFSYQGEVGGSVLKGLGVTGGWGYSGGGGIRFESSGSLLSEAVTIHGCYGGSEGGGIFAIGGSLTIESSTLRNNYAIQSGGAVAVEYGSLVVHESTAAENVAPVFGGGVYAVGSSLTVIGSTISNNQSLGFAIHGQGAGIAFNGGDSLQIASSTITGNRASFSSGLHVRHTFRVIGAASQSGAGVAISDSIISGNLGVVSNEEVPADLGGTWYSPLSLTIDTSHLGDTSELLPPDTWTGDGNVFSTEPLLGPLADNGGPTHTHALLPGSPALDAGDPAYVGAAFDQRGEPYTRVVGGRIDIGAYEAQATPIRAPGDYNADGIVDAADYSVWRDGLGVVGLTPLTGADGDGDGEVTRLDHGVWRTHYGFAYDPPGLPDATDAAYAAWSPEPARRPARTAVRETFAPAADAGSHLDALLLTHAGHSSEDCGEHREESRNDPHPAAKERTASASPVRKAIPRVGDPI